MNQISGIVELSNLRRNGYVRIQDHGMIASNRTAALVALDGTIDWACLPNFDSDPIFSALLDKSKGGYIIIKPNEESGVTCNQHYLEQTNILVTEFYKGGKVLFRLTDFIPTSEYGTINFPEIHRYLEAPSVDVVVKVKVRPSFDYDRTKTIVTKEGHGFSFTGKGDIITLSCDLDLRVDRDSVSGLVTMRKGTSKWIVVSHGISYAHRVTDYRSYERLEETSSYWHTWVSQSQTPGVYHHSVTRSSLALKALFFEPTGLMVAAPTSSLPECVGGERNWDYRYAWIRDTAYVVESLSMLGYKKEAIKFLYDMMDTIRREKRIRTIYSVSSQTDLDEIEVDFDGYMGSRPVRFGNKASDQLQIDEYGSFVTAISHLSKIGGIISSYLWGFVGDILKDLEELWNKPDSSIWEFRTEPRHYTYSKVMAWSAFNRAIEMGKALNYTGQYQKWKTVADTIKSDVLRNGYDPELNSFVQYYGAKHTDAALLRIPLLGILPPTDPRMMGTVRKIEQDLMADGFLFKRYPNDDGIKCKDNAFTLLSFWYVEDLVEMKEYLKARDVFESLVERGNHLGLFSEEIDFETGEQIGNFPQAMTHLGIIRAAYRLNQTFKKNVNGKGSRMIH